MTPELFDVVLRGFCRRRPFRRFLIEFLSGGEVQISHPEAIRREDDLYVVRTPDLGVQVFVAPAVSRVMDAPTAATS